MKKHHLVLITAALTGYASAQVTSPPTVVVEEKIVEVTPGIVEVTPSVVETTPKVLEVTPGIVEVNPAPGAEVQIAQRRLDAALARQRLGIAPVLVPAPAAGATIIETTNIPLRVYNTERNVVVVEGKELPYLTIPVLFVEGTADLLDVESRLAIEDTALAIKDVLLKNPTAVFDVEGHTSTDGADEMNMQLSADRSRRIYTELIEKYGVPTTALAAHGYGENYPKYPNGTEQQMVLDRRVLVVRVK